MVNIYTFKDLFVCDDNVYKDMIDSNPKYSFSDVGIQAYKDGAPLTLEWACDAANKEIGTKIMAADLGLASKKEVIKHLKKYAPSAMVNPIVIDGSSDVYDFLQPKCFDVDSPLLDHFFIMFKIYKAVVVTEKFKAYWESKGYTGAVFTHVGEMDDARFPDVS